MAKKKIKPLTSEEERQITLQQWEEDGSKVNDGHCHELLDRLHLFSKYLENDVLNHPACFTDKQTYAYVWKAVGLLNLAYQEVGSRLP